MKTNSIIKSALFAVSFSAIALIGNASAAPVVNVDINDGTTPVSGTYSGVGAAPDAGTFWNGFTVYNNVDVRDSTSFTESSLKDSSGVTTSTSVTLSANTNFQSFDAGNYSAPAATAPALMNDLVYDNGSPVTVAISGLVAGDTYNLYFYSEGGGFYSGSLSMTIGATTESSAVGGSDPGGFVLGKNYVEFTGVVANGSGDITGTDTAGDYLNGFQLVDTTVPAVVPEPSTYALMGLGALALLVISRRRRTA